MTHTDQLQDAINRALNANTPSERRWWQAHHAYLTAVPASRAAYRAIRDQAAELGMDAPGFDAACRAEIDEDVAGNDSGEWVRAAREVFDICEQCAYETLSMSEPNEEEMYEKAMWIRSCNAALEDGPWY